MIHDHMILAVLWIAFGLLHSLLAALWWKRRLVQWMGVRYKYYTLLYSLFAAITLVLVLVYQYSIGTALLWRMPVWAAVLVCIPALGGLVIMGHCIQKYFLALSGIGVFFKKQPPVKLELGGMHRYVRHPLYAGTLLFCWCLFLLFPWLNNLIAVVVITVYTVIGARFEEQKLIREFGEQYVYYRKQVPMLIPGIKPVISRV